MIHHWLCRCLSLATPSRLSGCGLLVAVLIALVDCPEALARAGGGHSFSGGGGHSYSGGGHSSSGSHSSGGDGSIILLYYLIRFLVMICIDHPFVGIPVAIGLGYFAYHFYRAGRDGLTGGVIRRGQLAHNQISQQQIVNLLQKNDPAFQAEAFLVRARAAFLTAQKSWCAQELTPLRPFVSDGIYERWELQLSEERELGFRDRMEDLNIRRSGLADCRISGETEELTVFFTAQAADFRVRLTDGRPLPEADTTPHEFTEYWTFLRRRGSPSLRDKEGLLEGRCPNCGSPIGINQSAQCQSCGAFLRSGEFDWVLAEITQEEVFAPASNQPLPGVAALQSTDPFFTPQLIEDRASVVFWRWLAALRKRDIHPLSGNSSPELAEAIRAKFQASPRVYYQECAVGAASLHGIIREEELDHALVEMVWSGEAVTVNDGSEQEAGRKLMSRTLFVFTRATGVPSAAQSKVGSAHCPGCGAPEDAGSGGLCKYCGSPLNSPRTNWTLTALCALSTEAAQVWLEKLTAQADLHTETGSLTGHPEESAATQPGAGGFSPSAYAVLAWMVKMATSDKEITPEERRLLLAAGKSRRIPQATVENMIAAAQAGTFQPPEPHDNAAALDWLRGMARLALADGKIMAAELELLQNMAERCGYTDYDLQMLLKKERGELYRQAQEDIRQTRQMQRTPPKA